MWQPPRESEYTQPRPFCEHPEYWKSDNIMSAEQEVGALIAALVRACQPELVVEIGSHYGLTSEKIGNALVANGHGRMIGLEIEPGLAESGRIRTRAIPTVEIITIDSLVYIPPEPIDFLYVDGQLSRILDVEHYRPYLTERALVVVHDMAQEYYRDQMPRMIELLGNQAICLDTPRGLIIWKLGEPFYGTSEEFTYD